jgi:hypothetical protein
MKTSSLAKHIAEKTEDAYSADRYSNWAAVAEVLLQRGHSEAEVEEILRSKWTRWAADASNKPYGKASSKSMLSWLEHTFDSLAHERREVTAMIEGRR